MPDGANDTLQPAENTPLRVLLVDDEEEMLLIGGLCLRQIGYQPVAVNNGQKALEVLAQDHFDVALLDLYMPGMNGVELFKHIEREYPEIPVIFSTGYNITEWAEQLGDSQPAGVLKKPYTPEQLDAEIRRVLKPADDSPTP